MNTMALTLYDLAITTVQAGLNLFGRWFKSGSKIKDFVEGQQYSLRAMNDATLAGGKGCIWFHAASLGEYNAIHPVMKLIRKQANRKIVLTFFSPTGIKAMKNRSIAQRDADEVYLLPLDTHANVARFLDAVRPSTSIFAISEYWPNYVNELYKRGIPTYLVASYMGPGTTMASRPIRLSLKSTIKKYTEVMVLDKDSEQLLHRMGVRQARVIGDPLFDNAVQIAATPYRNTIVEHFKASAQGKMFIAGSISDKNDLQLVCSLANRHRRQKCILVPHEISEEHIHDILYHFEGKALLHSECSPETCFDDVQLLIIDYLGDLPFLYRYAEMAYVGGGFSRLLHSVLEPLAYGIPVAFGPKTHRKPIANHLVKLGIGQRVHNRKSIEKWYLRLANNPEALARIRYQSQCFIQKNSHVSETITERILKELQDG